MNTQLRSFIALLSLATVPAAAQVHSRNPVFSVRLPANGLVSPAQATRISAKLNHIAFDQQRDMAQHKTAVNEKLLAVSVYDFTAVPSQQLTDSIRLFYDSSRGSAYDYNNLAYDFDNNADYPYNSTGILPAGGFLNYDTMRAYVPAGSPGDLGLRQYNIFNKVSVSNRPVNPDITIFEYDPFAKLTKTTVLDNSNGAGLDSSTRDFYSYNTVSGFIERDSIQDRNGTLWTTDAIIRIINNAAGLPVQESVFLSSPLGTFPFATLNLNYSVTNQLVSATIRAANNFSGPLVNQSKDTFSYTTGLLTSHDNYSWDTTAKTWIISSVERRHLNISGLVDNVFTRYYSNAGAPIDSAVQKLGYNGNDNPTVQSDYTGDGMMKNGETRYYYTLPIPSAVPALKLSAGVYPNPASDKLYVKGLGGGHFSIVNTAGQVVAKGSLQQNGLISLCEIPAGIYQLVAEDLSGIVHQACFVKE